MARAKGRYLNLLFESPEVKLARGLTLRGGVGEQIMVNIVDFQAGAEAPSHAHIEEQVMLVVEGELQFELDGVIRLLGPGEAAFIPSGVPHGMRAGTSDCRAVAILSPPQPALIERMLHEEHVEHGFA